MKIIGVGFGRTGTSSLKVAAETLGFGPCLHMDDVVSSPSLGHEWAALFADSVPDREAQLIRLVDGYDSVVDWPACSFWRDLIRIYPDAAVVLTLRDTDSWVRSFVDTLAPLWDTATRKPENEMTDQAEHVGYYRLAKALAHKEFGGAVYDRAALKRRFLEHAEQVRSEVPNGRLLIYSVADGWKPLCTFLGRDTPDIAFPNMNDRETFKAKAQSVFSG